MESRYKTLWKYKGKGEEVSAREPDFYAKRFKKFMKNEVFISTSKFDIEEEMSKLSQGFVED